MKALRWVVVAIALSVPGQLPAQIDPAVREIQRRALVDDTAYQIITQLAVDIGARPAGSATEAKAREWAVRYLTSAGFRSVRSDGFPLRVWIRGHDQAEMTAPVVRPLTVTAMGNSGSTGTRPLMAKVVAFESLDALSRADPSQARGRIVYVGHAMRVTQDGSAYRALSPLRFRGPNMAAKLGAAAMLIRSLGTEHTDNPHTGATVFETDVKPIPVAALTNPDADALETALRSGKPVRVSLTLRSHVEYRDSGNVTAEVPGSDAALPPVLIACHLDSWDLGTGAVDDAAGCGIIIAAARIVAATLGQQRTIRLLLAGAEEIGALGGKAYANRFSTVPHFAAMEADFGADAVWSVRLPDAGPVAVLKPGIIAALAPLGIFPSRETAQGGADIQALAALQNVPLIDLVQDGTRYFDFHHSPADTIDKVDRARLQQAVAGWATTLYLLTSGQPGAEAGK